MTGRRSGSVALFPVGFVCSGGSLSVCLSPLGARSVCLSPLGARSVCLSLLHGQAIFTESVPGEGVPQSVTWSGILPWCVPLLRDKKQANVLVDSFQCAK